MAKTKTDYSSSVKPPPGSTYAVMSVGAFVGTSILMSIPLIGLVICIIWAFVNCSNENRRNFARAYFIFIIIGIVFSIIIFIVTTFFAASLGTYGGFTGMMGIFDLIRQFGGN